MTQGKLVQDSRKVQGRFKTQGKFRISGGNLNEEGCRHGKLAGSVGFALGGCGDSLGSGVGGREDDRLEVSWVATQGNTGFLERTEGTMGLVVWACGSLEVLHGGAEEKFGVLFRRQEGNLDVCW